MTRSFNNNLACIQRFSNPRAILREQPLLTVFPETGGGRPTIIVDKEVLIVVYFVVGLLLPYPTVEAVADLIST
jgi:hypothetical protein